MTSYTLRTMELAVLRVLSDGTKAHKFAVIGRPYQAGSLEHQLQITFTNDDRECADRAFESLRHKSMIRSTYSDLIDPLNWVEITTNGKHALERRLLDQLDEVLDKILPHLVEIRAGAWEAVHSGGVDSLRQAAHSGRELIDQTLKEGAPDSVIRSEPDFAPDKSSNSGITRRQRLKYLMRKARGQLSDTDIKIAEEACDLVMAVDTKLQAESHSREVPSMQEVRDALAAAEIALRALLT